MGENFSTTFHMYFAIAEHFGIDAIKDTFKRAFEEWKDQYQYLTDLAMVTNHRCWYWHEKGNEQYSQLYSDYYYQVHDYALEHLEGEELSYYFRITD